MKKFFRESSVFMGVIFGAALFSCQKQTPQPEVEEIVPEVEEIIEIKETLTPGIVLVKKTELCLLGRDGKMHKIFNVTEGEEFDAIALDDVTQTYELDGKTYIKVVNDFIEYWLDESTFAQNAEPAVIIENSFLYEDKNLTKKLEEKLSMLKFGAIIARYKSDSLEKDCDKIYYYDKNDARIKTAYIKAGNLSNSQDDFHVIRIVESLKVTTRAAPRNDLFARAAKYHPCAKVKAALEAQKTGTVTNSYQEALNALPKGRYGVNVQELLTVDQSKDPFQ